MLSFPHKHKFSKPKHLSPHKNSELQVHSILWTRLFDTKLSKRQILNIKSCIIDQWLCTNQIWNWRICQIKLLSYLFLLKRSQSFDLCAQICKTIYLISLSLSKYVWMYVQKIYDLGSVYRLCMSEASYACINISRGSNSNSTRSSNIYYCSIKARSSKFIFEPKLELARTRNKSSRVQPKYRCQSRTNWKLC